MKKSVVVGLGVLLIGFSPMVILAQKAERQSQKQLPQVEVRISSDQVPSPVKDALQQDYGEGHKPLVWINDNLVFKAEENKDTQITHYTVQSKASNGSTLYVHYSPDGKRINSREYLKNCAPAEPVINTLRNTEFKDWALKRNITIRKSSNGGSEKERNYLTMKKGKTKKTLVLDENGRFINEGKSDLAEAGW